MLAVAVWLDGDRLLNLAPTEMEQGEDGLWRVPGTEVPALPGVGWFKLAKKDEATVSQDHVLDGEHVVLYFLCEELAQAQAFIMGVEAAQKEIGRLIETTKPEQGGYFPLLHRGE